MMKRLPLVLALISLIGCRGEAPSGDPGLVLDMGISPTPPGVGPARLIITLTDTLGIPISDATVAVEGNMSHAGMVPVLDTARMDGPGQYLVEAFQFTMAGDWILTLQATLPDGRVAIHRETTNVVTVPPGIDPSLGQPTQDTSDGAGHRHTPPATDTAGGDP